MLIHLDTNVISDLVRQDARVLARLTAATAQDKVLRSVVVRGEVLFGIDRLAPGKKQQELRTRVNSIFSYIDCEAIRSSAGDHYSRAKCTLEKKGAALGQNDLWIAACALDSGAILVTRDNAFSQISDLIVQNWAV